MLMNREKTGEGDGDGGYGMRQRCLEKQTFDLGEDVAGFATASTAFL